MTKQPMSYCFTTLAGLYQKEVSRWDETLIWGCYEYTFIHVIIKQPNSAEINSISQNAIQLNWILGEFDLPLFNSALAFPTFPAISVFLFQRMSKLEANLLTASSFIKVFINIFIGETNNR